MKRQVFVTVSSLLVGCSNAPETDSTPSGSTSTTGSAEGSTSSPGETTAAAGDSGSESVSSDSGSTTTSADGSSTGESSGEAVAPQSPAGRLVIDEVYFTGAEPAAGVDHYFSDQFIALRNNADVPVALGGLILADVFGVAGEINPGIEPNAVDDSEHVYLSSVWMLPGQPEDVVLEPGERLVIAQDGTNHAPFSTVDLSGADFETFVEQSEQDDDYPTVENLDLLHYNAGFDWLIPVFGPSIVIIDSSDPLRTHQHDGWTLVAAPVSTVVDGVDILMDGDSAPYKRLPSAVDAGFTFASGTYVGQAVRRRRDGTHSVDTDDSTADFEVTSEPTPRF